LVHGKIFSEFKIENHFRKCLTRGAAGSMLGATMGLCADTQHFPSALSRLVMAAVSVEAFIHRHSDHDHDGAEGACSVCMQLAIAQHMLDSLACIALALSASFAADANKPATVQFFCVASPLTLISLKVQFNT
jgi:hypothetical protein